MMMKRRVLIAWALLFVLCINLIGCGNSTLESKDKKRGEFLCAIDSPTEEFSLEFYRFNGGATTSYAVLGVLINKTDNTEKNIYYKYDIGEVTTNWINDYIIEVNGVKLDIRYDSYYNTDKFDPLGLF